MRTFRDNFEKVEFIEDLGFYLCEYFEYCPSNKEIKKLDDEFMEELNEYFEEKYGQKDITREELIDAIKELRKSY